MDQITKGLLSEFVTSHGLEPLSEDVAFEHFASFLIASTHVSESLDTEDIVVGAGNDCGIDAFAVIVNGSVVTEPEEIDDLVAANNYLDVTFVIIQAKRSANFEMAKIGHFGFGVQDFFAEESQLPQNLALKHKALIVKKIFANGRLFTKGNPQCFLYYATTGKWTEDQNLSVRRDAVRVDVEEAGVFRRVEFTCIDARRLQELYRQAHNAVVREINFSQRTVIPDVPGVEQAYIGILSAPEFLKLITSESGEILASIFYDNVRDWQDWNAVNSEMRETLLSEVSQVNFPILNNGITVVAKVIRPTANRFVIEDYQIVNGCQSSYVLFECRASLGENVMIPVRLIATQDENIKNSIIKATNRQTQVTEEQLFALSEFPKQLEAFFPTHEGKGKLFYERRSRQYASTPNIERVRIVNMTVLVRAFASIFLEQPHRTTRNYKALLRGVGTQIFGKDHKLEPYYLAAYAQYRLEFLFRNGAISAELKIARYHILLAYRVLSMEGKKPPSLESNEMKRYAVQLIEKLWDDAESQENFLAAAELVWSAAAGNFDRDNIRSETFTTTVLAELQARLAATGQNLPAGGDQTTAE